ncbi:hypothetical protein BH09CHL1_BH09CHL1_05280 [soil metagenome]
MRRLSLWIVLAICVIASIESRPAAAAPEVPSINFTECTSEPIAVPQKGEVGDLTLPSPTATEIDESNTTPADEATIEAITQPIVQSLACQNAGDVLQMLASFSDRWIAEQFTGYDLVFYGRFVDAANSATPVPDDGQVALVSIDDVRVRTDGSVLATVSTSVNGQEQTSLLVLVNTSTGWKIDGSQAVS